MPLTLSWLLPPSDGMQGPHVFYPALVFVFDTFLNTGLLLYRNPDSDPHAPCCILHNPTPRLLPLY